MPQRRGGELDARRTAQQIVEAIGAEIAPARLIRELDAIFGVEFDARVDNLGVRQIRTSPSCPWHDPPREQVEQHCQVQPALCLGSFGYPIVTQLADVAVEAPANKTRTCLVGDPVFAL